VATIFGETARGLRLLPALTAGQALGLLGTAGAAWAAWAAPDPGVVRLGLCATTTVLGLAYTVGRWPLHAEGERLAVWLPRLVRYLLRPRVRAGAAVPGWEGLQDLRGDRFRHDQGWACVLECTGTDLGLGGPEVATAAQVAYREVLHALARPLQVVGVSRWLRADDRPAVWDPAAAPPGLISLAQTYATHWDCLVAERRAVVRRCLFVPSLGPDPRPGSVQGALQRFCGRLGLTLHTLRPEEVIALLRTSAGSADPTGGVVTDGSYRVGVVHG